MQILLVWISLFSADTRCSFSGISNTGIFCFKTHCKEILIIIESLVNISESLSELPPDEPVIKCDGYPEGSVMEPLCHVIWAFLKDSACLLVAHGGENYSSGTCPVTRSHTAGSINHSPTSSVPVPLSWPPLRPDKAQGAESRPPHGRLGQKSWTGDILPDVWLLS